MKKTILLIMLGLATCIAIESSAIQLLTRDQLPKLTKDELINQINKTKEILPGYFIEALTISDDNKILIIGDIHGSVNELIAAINLMRKEGHNAHAEQGA